MNRNKQLTTTLLLSLISFQMTAQEVLFENKYGGNGASNATAVIETHDGGLMMVGYTEEGSAGLVDYHLVKTDAMGEEEWTFTHGGFNNDVPTDAIQLEDSSFVVVGYTGSFTTFPARDVYLIKVDNKGELLWTKSIGGSGTDEGTGIKATSDGGFIISALTESFGAGDRDGWLIKTDSIGDTTWTSTFGGSESDDAWDIEIAADSGYLLTGGSYSLEDGDQDDLWLIKADKDGNEEWIKTFGTEDILDWGWDLTVVNDGYVIVGMKDNDPALAPPASGDAHFIKTDLNGNLLWDNSIPHNFRLEATSIDTCSDGGFIIGGMKVESPTQSSFWIARTDDKGDLIWTKDLGVTNALNRVEAIIQTKNHDIVAVGYGGFQQGIRQSMRMARIKDSTDQVGLKDALLSNHQLLVYPNPSSGQFRLQIESSTHQIQQVQILSAPTGQLIQNLEITNDNDLNFQLETAGLYLLRAFDRKGLLLGSTKVMVATP